jgi:hypothetical protein
MFRKVEITIIEDQNLDILIFGWAEKIFFLFVIMESDKIKKFWILNIEYLALLH